MSRLSRPKPLTLLVASMLVLLPVLAFFQYRWLGQLSDAEQERLQRNLRAATSELERSLDLELIRTVIGLQLDAMTLREEAWSRYSERVAVWSSAAVDPSVVSAVWLIDEDPSVRTSLRVRRWDSTSRTFDDAAWPDTLHAIRARLETEHRGFASAPSPLFHRPSNLLTDDESALVLPVMPGAPETASDSTFRVQPVFAFTVVVLDQRVIRRRLVPALVTRHLGAPDVSEYHVAIVSRSDSQDVIYEGRTGDAAALVAHADVDTHLFGLRGDRFALMRRAAEALRPPGERHSGDPPREMIFGLRLRRFGMSDEQRGSPDDRARWRLLVRHRAGSLEAAVGRARQRNLAVSFGLLVMMGVSVGLIVVGARRAQRLGEQQLEFVAAVSHELRTPVAVIGAAADNLAEGVVTDRDRIREYGSTIRAEARRLGETVERVLEFAGIQAGRVTGLRETVQVNDVIDAALATAEPLISQHRMTVELDVPQSLPAVVADPAALRSALENLIANAAKHTASPGRLRVGATLATTAGGSELQIHVTDRGPGIPAAERSRVFEPFYRGSDALSRRIPGSGLGLSIVKSIVEAHGGRVSVVSEIGVGSTFTLHLPALDAEPERLETLVGHERHAEG